jgi:ABC-type amino acid transport substrate-binding protein
MMRIPSDTFNLLVMFNQIVSGRFGAMLATISILTITLLCAGAVGGRLKVSLHGLIRYVVVTVVLMTVSVVGVRVFFNNVVAHQYAGYRMFIDQELEHDLVTSTAQSETMKSFPPADRDETAVERIRRRGKIRVGYLRDLLPWAFINSASHLVGFDVEMAHILAHDLGVEAEFVRLEGDQMAECLDSGYCDIIMSGIAITTDRAEKISFSTSYMDQTMAFVVEDSRRDEFNSREAVQRLRGLRIGMLDLPYFIRLLKNYLPDATIVPLDTAREFFRDESHDLDALVYSAEGGSAWCLIYPQYTVAIPHPDVAAVPMAYPIARGENEMRELVNTWVELKKRDGTIRRAYDHWILGKGAQKTGPRWCVIRDVLHWVD